MRPCHALTAMDKASCIKVTPGASAFTIRLCHSNWSYFPTPGIGNWSVREGPKYNAVLAENGMEP